MKNILLLLLLLTQLSAQGKAKYTKFIETQLQYTYAMDEHNISKEKLQNIVDLQETSYKNALDYLMIHKSEFINHPNLYDKEIFSLKKIMSINKRAGNKNAYLRDEIQLKSYQLLRLQNLMIKEILVSLDKKDLHAFGLAFNKIITKYQKKIEALYTKNYKNLLPVTAKPTTLSQIQKNIREFYALRIINSDIVNNLYKLQSKMYRLNKYTKYHIIKFVLLLNKQDFIVTLNNFLEDFGLSIMKIIFILALSILIYFFRKFTEFVLQKYIFTLELLEHYSKDIMHKLYKPFDYLVLVINANMILYVYNDFSSFSMTTKVFNILYGMFFTYIIYKIINTIATIKIATINRENNGIKNEMINVSIKIINFLILIIGILIVLYFAGVNLTAVLSGLGIGGFAVAFAAKDTISNFFGTLSILFSNVFSQGDWIIVGKNEGVVVEIGLRVTTLRTFDNALISIPNGNFATMEVKNWNRRVLGRRIKMSLGIKYDSKTEDIKNAVAQIRTMLDKHAGIATENTKYKYKEVHGAKLISKDNFQGVKKTLLVYLDEFAPSSMNILVYCFTKSVDWQEWLEIKEDVMHKIMKIFEENNLEFAFPSLSIYNESEHLPLTQ